MADAANGQLLKSCLSLQTISTDSNAEKLCSHYEPHVCLTRDALVRLLDNHGPDFGEQWEVPVWVKVNPGKGVYQYYSATQVGNKKKQQQQKYINASKI